MLFRVLSELGPLLLRRGAPGPGRYRDLRVLYSTVMAPPYANPYPLSDRQVLCGPRWPDENRSGRVVSRQTPLGTYDVGGIVERLPRAQRPEVFFAYVDATGACLPLNTRSLRCPRVALIADVHHRESPIARLLEYLARERFDYHFIVAARQHARWFQAARLPNLYACGAAMLVRPYQGAIRTAAEREPVIAFAGQAGRFHPRRARLLQAMRAAQLPVKAGEMQQAEALELFAGARLSFNCSLNGDLNMRVFEALSAGACLLTDRLCPEAGTDSLFTDGRDLVCFDAAEDLVEKARHYLARPDEAAAIAASGRQAWEARMRPERKVAEIMDLVIGGRAAPALGLDLQRSAPPLDDRFGPRLACYQVLQELNRQMEQVRVGFTPGVFDFETDARDLLRLRAARLGADHAADRRWDVVVTTWQDIGALEGSGRPIAAERWLVVGNAQEEGPGAVARMDRRGCRLVSALPGVDLFESAAPG